MDDLQDRPRGSWLKPAAAAAAVVAVVAGASVAATSRKESETPTGYVPPPAVIETVPSRPGAPTRPISWQAVRTDRDPLTLVVTYIGAGDPACQSAVSATVSERPDEVVLALTAEEPAPVYVTDGEGRRVQAGCRTSGILRMLPVRLAAPLGNRSVVDPAGRVDTGTGFVRHTAFDGSRLLTPTGLPKGYVRGPESAFDIPGEDATWSRSWSDASQPFTVTPAPSASSPPAGDGTVCNPAVRPSINVQQHSETPSNAIPDHWRPVDTVTIDGQTAKLLRSDRSGTSLTWFQPDAQQEVTVQSRLTCGDSEDFSEADFLRIAESLTVVDE